MINEFDKGGTQYAAHGEFFRLCKKYWKPSKAELESEEFWNTAREEIVDFVDKYCTADDHFWSEVITCIPSRLTAMVGEKIVDDLDKIVRRAEA
jgi:hypothetical protein